MGTISAYDKINYSQLKLPTFQEMAMAPAYLTQKHEESQDALASIMSEANKAELLAKESPNGTSSKAYQDYVNQLNEATESLTKKGVNASNVKSKISTARGTYNKAILPILQAGETRAKYSQVLTEAKSKDQSLEIAPIDNSVDAWVSRAGQMPAIQGASGEELHKQVATVASTFKSQIEETMPELKQVMGPNGRPLLDEYIYYKSAGYKPQRIAELLGGKISPEKMTELDKQLTKVVDDVMVANNVYGMFAPDSAEAERLKTRASMGLYEAVGGTQMGKFTDEATRTDRNQRNAAALDIETYKAKKTIDAVAAMNATLGGLGNLYPTVDEATLDNKDIKAISGIEEELTKLGNSVIPEKEEGTHKYNYGRDSDIGAAKKIASISNRKYLEENGIEYKNRPASAVLKDVQNLRKYKAVAYASHEFKVSNTDEKAAIEYILERDKGFVDENGEPISKRQLEKMISFDKDGTNITGTTGHLRFIPTTGQLILTDGKKNFYVNTGVIDTRGLSKAQNASKVAYANKFGIPLNEVSPKTISARMGEMVKNKVNNPKTQEMISSIYNSAIIKAVQSGRVLDEATKRQMFSDTQDAVQLAIEQDIQKDIWDTTDSKGNTVGQVTKSAMDDIFTYLFHKNTAE